MCVIARHARALGARYVPKPTSSPPLSEHVAYKCRGSTAKTGKPLLLRRASCSAVRTPSPPLAPLVHLASLCRPSTAFFLHIPVPPVCLTPVFHFSCSLSVVSIPSTSASNLLLPLKSPHPNHPPYRCSGGRDGDARPRDCARWGLHGRPQPHPVRAGNGEVGREIREGMEMGEGREGRGKCWGPD